MEKNLTGGSVFKTILFFSLPYLLSYLLQTLYGMADLYIIGQFGTVAQTTAVSVGSQVMHMLTVMIVGLAMGATVFIGQAVGAGDKKKAAKGIGNTVTIFMAVAAVLTLLLVLLVKSITALMSTPADAIPGTIDYLTICFIGIPFITAYNVLSAIFRGMGDSKSPMYFIAIACAANIVLDYLFIGIFHLGPAGAALGTTLSQAMSVLVSLFVILKRNTGIHLSKGDFRPEGQAMGSILKIGIPVAFQDGLIQVAFIIITIIANHRGLNDSAAVGIVEKVMSFLFLVPSSMLSTVSALGAQNIGAGKPKRAADTLRYAAFLAVGFGFAAAVLIQFSAESIVGLFTDTATKEGMEVVRLGGQYLRGYVWDCIFAGVHFCFSGYFCAIEKSGISFLHNIIAIVLMRIPGVYLTSKLFPESLFPMGLATASGSVISVIICVIAFSVLMRRENGEGKYSMDKQKLFSIGDVAGLFHLSVSSLRHYEEAGLLIPEYIDPDSRYRYYGARQFEVLNSIRYLRALDMPLSEIADFLSNREIERMEEKLQSQKRAVIEKQKELKRIERKINNRLRMIEDAKHSVFDTVCLNMKKACRMVWAGDSLKIRGFLDMEEPIRKLEDKQAEAVVFLGKVGVGISAENLRSSRFDSYDGIFLILDEEDHFEGTVTEVPETLCVSIRFRGSHAEAAEHYRRLMNYIEEHKMEIDGFSREITMIDYGLTNDTEKFVTEISIPVRCRMSE